MPSKGKKRAKGKTVALSSFLNEDQEAAPGFTSRHVDWAETMENESIDDRYTLASDIKKLEKVLLPTAPKAARGPDVDIDKIPNTPPFTAYVGNLPYEVNEEDISKFFKKIDLDVTSVRIPREVGERGRMRGFGYAEFPDRKSLVEALSMNNETLKNRSIKVSLATEHVENERGGPGGMRGGDDRIDRTAGDWRTAPKEESSQPQSYRSDRYEPPKSQGRGFEQEPYRGRSSYDRDSSRFERSDQSFGDRDFDRNAGSGGRGGGFERSRFGGDRDRGGGFDSFDRNKRTEDSFDRPGGGSRRDFGSSFHEGSSDRNDFSRDNAFKDRRGDGGGSFDRPDDFARRGRDNYRDRQGGDEFNNFRKDGGYNRRGGDDYRERGGDDFGERKGNFDRDGGGSYNRSTGSERSEDEPKERPKLQLQPRSKAIQDSAPSPAKTTSTSSIFGGAKPVDTATKEMEIERRLAKERDEKMYVLERDRKDDGPKRGGSESGRSRQTSESSRNYRSSCSEDDGPPNKPLSKPRHNSSGSTGSDRERDQRPSSGRQSADEDYDAARKKNLNESRANGDVKERPYAPPKVLDSEPVNYASQNVFSHLSPGDEDGGGSASD